MREDCNSEASIKSNETYSTEKEAIKCYKRYAPLYDFIFGSIFQQGRKAIIKEIKKIK